MKKYLKILIILLLFLLLSAGICINIKNGINKDYKSLTSSASGCKNTVIQKFPIFKDYITPEKNKKLRTHLLRDHLKIAELFQLKPVNSEDEAGQLLKTGKLLKIKRDGLSNYFFYNVPEKNRYLYPVTYKGLILISNEFQKTLREFGFNGRVKFAVSSALRNARYQQKLRNINRNAVVQSSHSYGISFDIFFDAFFVDIDLPELHPMTDLKTIKGLKNQFGYMLGESLRRQFKAALTETLIRLQDQGLLYAILEKRQRCYHVTIIREP